MSHQGQRGRGPFRSPHKPAGATPPGRKAIQRQRKKERKSEGETTNAGANASVAAAPETNGKTTAPDATQGYETAGSIASTATDFGSTTNRGTDNAVEPTKPDNTPVPADPNQNAPTNTKVPTTSTPTITSMTTTVKFAAPNIASLDINNSNTAPALKSRTLFEGVMDNYTLTFGGVVYDFDLDMSIEKVLELIEEEWRFNEALLRLLGHKLAVDLRGGNAGKGSG